jgi:hypothetical protein
MSNIDKRNIISKIATDIEHYYTNKIKMYGPTARGVDWKDENSQLVRFTQLAKILDKMASQ